MFALVLVVTASQYNDLIISICSPHLLFFWGQISGLCVEQTSEKLELIYKCDPYFLYCSYFTVRLCSCGSKLVLYPLMFFFTCRKMMDSGQIDFYQHDTVCSNTCRSTKFDVLINSTRLPPGTLVQRSPSCLALDPLGGQVPPLTGRFLLATTL